MIPHQCPQRLALQRGTITRHHSQHASEERSPAEVAQDSLNCELAPISLLADSSRHSPARKQPPQRSTDMHPRRRGRSQPPGNTSDPHHSRTRVPPDALTLVASNPDEQATWDITTKERKHHAQQRHRLPTKVRTQRGIHQRPDQRSPLHERGRLLP